MAAILSCRNKVISIKRSKLVFIFYIFTTVCLLCILGYMVYDKIQFQQPPQYAYWEDVSSSVAESSSSMDTASTLNDISSSSVSVSSSIEDTSQSDTSSVSGKRQDKSPNITKPININTASKSELMKLKGVGEVISQRIIDYRTNVGKFDKIEDIMLVSGIGEKKFADMKNYITV